MARSRSGRSLRQAFLQPHLCGHRQRCITGPELGQHTPRVAQCRPGQETGTQFALYTEVAGQQAGAGIVDGAGDDDLETVPADEEGRLILIEAGAAILLYAQAALRDAQHHAVLEHHGAVDHELHEAEWLSAERTVFVAAGLQGNDGRHFARPSP